MKNLIIYSSNHQNIFSALRKVLNDILPLMWSFENKISIMSLIKDLGINKVPKENKNQE
jgi:hypothetical protein